MLNNKYDKMFEINLEQNSKLQKLGEFYDSVKNGTTTKEMQMS